MRQFKITPMYLLQLSVLVMPVGVIISNVMVKKSIAELSEDM